MMQTDRHQLPAAVGGPPVEALAAKAEDVTRDWLVRVLARVSARAPERLPDHRLIGEVPALVRGIAAALAADSGLDELAGEGELRKRIESLGALNASAGQAVGDAVLEAAELYAAIAAALGENAAGVWPPERLAAAYERLAMVFARVQTVLVEGYLRERSDQLELLANTDPLTGLYNVRFMREQLAYLTQVHQRYGHPFSLLLMDVNGLKEINDSFGHAAGDEALEAVAATLRSQVRDVDVPVRLGGDEFCVLLSETDGTSARVLASRIADKARRCVLRSGAALRLSIGLAACPDHCRDPEALVELADASMYEAKRTGEAVGSPPGTGDG